MLVESVELNDAAQMRADRRTLVKFSVLVAISGDFRRAAADDRALARFDLVDRSDVAAFEPIDVRHGRADDFRHGFRNRLR